MPSAPDALDVLANLLGISRRELVRAIVDASHRDWLRALRRELRKQRELPEEEAD